MTNRLVAEAASLWGKLREVADTDVPRSNFRFKFLERLWQSSLCLRAAKQDLAQIARFGWSSPKFCELVFVDIRKVEHWLPPVGDWWSESGRVLAGDWDKKIQQIETNVTLRYSRMHWEQGIPWTEIRANLLREGNAGIAEFAVLEDLEGRGENKRRVALARLNNYQKLYEDVSVTRKLLPRALLDVPHFREHGGILVHFGPNGELIFGARGNHRFAIAKVLELHEVPVMVGLVHPSIVKSWRDLIVRK